MVGREQELALLRACFERVLERRVCELVTLMGQAGVGKSRLVQEFLGSVDTEARVLRGRCLPYGEGITFWPLAEVVRSAADISDADDPATARERLVALVAGSAEVADRVAAAIGLSSESFSLEEMFWGIRKLFGLLAAERPLVVVFDDIHWAERTFLDLIDRLVDSVERVSLLILCPARPELLEEQSTWDEDRAGHTLLALERLSEDESELVADNLLGGTPLPPEIRTRITKAAEGNPLFVEQVLSMLIDDGLLVRRNDGDWQLEGDIDAITVPPTISSLLAARVDRLGVEERGVIERGAVIGQVFDQAAVEALSPDQLRPLVGPALLGLVRKEFVAPSESMLGSGESFRFQHILIRDAVYQGLLKRARGELHEQFANWLERAAGPRLMEYEEITGYHLEQAFRYSRELAPVDASGRQLATRAAQRLGAAGLRASGRGDMPAAKSLLERAVSLLEPDDPFRLELVPDLGEALMSVGEFGQSETVLEEACASSRSIGDRRLEMQSLVIRLGLRYLTDSEGNAEQILADVKRAIAVFEKAEDHLGLAKAWRLVGWIQGTAGRYGEAERAVQRAIDEARHAGDRSLEARNLSSFALSALLGPTPVPDAIRRCERILDEATGDRGAEALVKCPLSHLYAMGGDFDRARSLYREARVTLEDLGGKLLAATTSLDSGRVEMLAGDPTAAEAEIRKDYQTLVAMGEKQLLSTLAALLGQVLYAQGRLEEAEECSRVSEEAAAQDDVESQALWRRVRAKVFARRGRHEEAEALAREAVRLIGQTESPVMQGNSLIDLGEVLQLAHRSTDAREPLAAALDLYQAKGNAVMAKKARARLADVTRATAMATG
jgi:predicted ATPase